jgi:broad specificity phosphatase PhoE
MFGDDEGGAMRLDGIYASDDRRAQQTAAPLIERLRHSPVVFAAPEARATAARALHEHAGGTVLVIASGPAFSQMVQELAGVPATAVADDPDVIYVVSIPSVGRAHLAGFRF